MPLAGCSIHEALETIKSVFSRGGKIFDGIKDGILNGLKTVINGIIDGINKVVEIPFRGLNTALEGLKSVSILGLKPFDWLPTIDIPQIPRLAMGAVIPPNKKFLLEVLSAPGRVLIDEGNLQMMSTGRNLFMLGLA